MAKLLVFVSMLFASISLFAQGTVIFNNRVAGQVDAPVMRPDGSGAGPGVNAQLFLVTPSGGSAVYTPILPATTFYDASINPLLTRYVVSPGTVQVPGVPAGQIATLVMRVWEGPSFETASAKAQSNPVTVMLGGQPAGAPAIPDPALVGLQGMTIPEPSTIALGILGAAALLYRRRAK